MSADASVARRFGLAAARRVAALALAVATAAMLAPAAVAATPAQRAAGYLARAQNADGGLGNAPGNPSGAMSTQWTALGVAAAGRSPAAMRRRGGRTLAAAVRAYASRARTTGDLERSILALRASRQKVPASLTRQLLGHRRADGSFDGLVNWTAFGVLALRAVGRSTRDGAVRAATRFLVRQQNRDGGWNVGGRGGRSGIDDTAGALQALVAGGRSRRSGPVRRGAAFIARQQRADGGFPLQPGGATNAQSTAWAVQALVAAGRNPDRVRRRGSRTPLQYLRSLQTANGMVRYSRTSAQTPVWVTAQALTAFARRPFPLR
ncbi:MAG: prenyltransferase/squalene oxidase repeat-containing protein [Solirubrobacteraceae bacterium]